jgi:hypothetical protein
VRMEAVERRVLGAIRFTDALSGLPATGPVTLETGGALVRRNRRGDYVIWSAPGFEAYVGAFEDPPAVPALGSRTVGLAVTQPGPHHLPRRCSVPLPRNPDPALADPAHPRHGESLFAPVEVALLPAPTASLGVNWAVLRVTVTDSPAGGSVPKGLPGVLLRVLANGGQSVLARGMTDWRGRARGEALVAVAGIPVTTFGGSGTNVLVFEIEAELEATFDPSFDPESGLLPDPDELELLPAGAQRKSQPITLAAGREEAVAVQIP